MKALRVENQYLADLRLTEWSINSSSLVPRLRPGDEAKIAGSPFSEEQLITVHRIFYRGDESKVCIHVQILQNQHRHTIHVRI